MARTSDKTVSDAEIVLGCDRLDETLAFFLDELGFRLERIFPADAPRVAVVSGLGSRIRLDASATATTPRLRLATADPAALAARLESAPDGLPVDVVATDPPVELPALDDRLIVTRAAGDAEWGAGRAGMQYRDLIPGRLGGRFIASHIRIPHGGPVPDYVHHHHVRFQLIYCYRGWVRVVYEDQGPPFVMHAGDCVLQPPHIRHRVLECSDAFEVVEIGCPAEHETLVDHDMQLPTGSIDPDREFGGQRFVFHQAEGAGWTPRPGSGFEVRDTGIGAASRGVGTVLVLRLAGDLPDAPMRHDAEFLFRFVLAGRVTLDVEEAGVTELAAGDAFVIPAGTAHALREPSADLELLEVALPAEFRLT